VRCVTYGHLLQKCGSAQELRRVGHRIRTIEPLPHNRFKLPFFAICAVIAVAFLINGMSTVSAVMMALVLVGSVAAVVTILSGRNPRWLRSPLDRREAEKRARQP
jgi:hypothetical protein